MQTPKFEGPTSQDAPAPSSQTITLRMPKHLIDRVDDLALREDTSRSQMMRKITAYVVDAIRNDPDSLEDYEKVAAHLYKQAKELIYRGERPSVSLLQRHFRLDYHIAMLLMDELERNGVVMPPDENGYRKTKLDHFMELANARKAAPDQAAGCWLNRKL